MKIQINVQSPQNTKLHHQQLPRLKHLTVDAFSNRLVVGFGYLQWNLANIQKFKIESKYLYYPQVELCRYHFVSVIPIPLVPDYWNSRYRLRGRLWEADYSRYFELKMS